MYPAVSKRFSGNIQQFTSRIQGKINKDDLVKKRWLIQDKKTNDEYLYTTIDELVAAGWAID